MSRVEVFSYALMLKGADRAEKIIELLDDGAQEEVKATLEALKDLPPGAIRQLWREGRNAEELAPAAVA
ncbi:MAG: hypothetical protein JO097_02595 [Acidobacteriaceae bacterium]|nr:hypothetical protein [Acidobacteriaceae bacterium]MBV9294972.1 hypothetical protein [Acidobacteriaceae bacterium]MBV9764832.1 hypothetical protein [Acidobacteriaceae bacterium]